MVTKNSKNQDKMEKLLDFNWTHEGLMFFSESKICGQENYAKEKFKLTWKSLEDLCSSKNSFLHTRNYATVSTSPAEGVKFLTEAFTITVYLDLFGMGFGKKIPNETLCFQLPHSCILQAEW